MRPASSARSGPESGSAAGWLTTCDARAPGPWASAPMCTVPPLMTMPLGSVAASL